MIRRPPRSTQSRSSQRQMCIRDRFKAEPTEAFIESGQCPLVTVVAVPELGRYENLLTRHAALLQRHADGVLVLVKRCGVYQPVTRVESPCLLYTSDAADDL